ncbi:daptide biosynthesis RiPP recognition protein [Microbacterium sp. SZ1]|uniref:daptide biosynthesis RiPP recognition protein n=1 Tax=Microbacterium sp. SZ1 TaxID=1849736 RepID=UPI00211CA079|nr:daptide biosynthesis RiPP recognition protein [Microbacterium sp. SZ1]
MDGSEVVGARALREFLTGERNIYRRVFLVDVDAPAEAVIHAAGAHDAVLLPEGTASPATSAALSRYSGRLEESGDEMLFGETAVELQDYVAAGFVQLVGPTVVAVLDMPGWEAFLDDARLARRTGVFPSALLDPRVVLAERSALERPRAIEIPNAIRVRADGAFTVGMRGEVVGHIVQTPDRLTEPFARGARLGGAPSIEELTAPGPGRDATARYLRAIDLLRMLRVVNGVRVSGFGWSLIDDDRADAEPSASDPFLLDTAEGFVLADVDSRRRRALSLLTAVVVEATQTSSARELAVERIARRLTVSASDAGRLCEDAIGALGISFGISTEGAEAARR